MTKEGEQLSSGCSTIRLAVEKLPTKRYTLVVNNKPVSSLILREENGVFKVFSMHTPRKYRRKGYATTLMQAILALGWTHRKIVTLRVRQSNVAACRLYEKVGMIFVGIYGSKLEYAYIPQ